MCPAYWQFSSIFTCFVFHATVNPLATSVRRNQLLCSRKLVRNDVAKNREIFARLRISWQWFVRLRFPSRLVQKSLIISENARDTPVRPLDAVKNGNHALYIQLLNSEFARGWSDRNVSSVLLYTQRYSNLIWMWVNVDLHYRALSLPTCVSIYFSMTFKTILHEYRRSSCCLNFNSS